MSPTPVSLSHPTAPAGYTWEATTEQVAARSGLPVARIARFDLNTSPSPPELAARILAAGRFETGMSEYPPSDYRRLSEAAAARYGVAVDEILVGAGADEVLDVVAKAYLPADGTAVIPTPSYAMYRVLTEQRRARVRPVPRLGSTTGYAMDVGMTRMVARGADLVWLCSPNNPTALPEPEGAIAELLDGLRADAATDGRRPPAVVLDEAYAEFAGSSLIPLRARYPELIVVRTMSKAYALAGIRVGFAVAPRATLAVMEPYRPPGSVSTISVEIATQVLLEPSIIPEAVDRITTERARLAAGLAAEGWIAEPSVTNFLLVPFGSPERAASVTEALLQRGLVPRTFGASHPLADHLRLTVRSVDEDDRLIAAAAEIGGDRSAGSRPAPGSAGDR